MQQIISSGLANAGDLTAIAAILIASGEVSSSILSQPFATFGNGLTLTGLRQRRYGNLSLNAADTRSLDQVQLRLDDNAEGTIRSGTRYPITTSSYSSIAATVGKYSGHHHCRPFRLFERVGNQCEQPCTASSPFPRCNMRISALTFKVTPRIERNDDVVLKLDFKIQALQGASLNGLPVLTNRSYTADIHLRQWRQCAGRG